MTELLELEYKTHEATENKSDIESQKRRSPSHSTVVNEEIKAKNDTEARIIRFLDLSVPPKEPAEAVESELPQKETFESSTQPVAVIKMLVDFGNVIAGTYVSPPVYRIEVRSLTSQTVILPSDNQPKGPYAGRQVLSARDLLNLPQKVRERLIAEAFEAAADEDFETFEAYSEEEPDA